MRKYTLHLVSLLSLALAMACLIPQRAAADDDDPPGRVARLGYVRGNVSFEPAGTDDWVSAVINRPLTTGDKLWNDADSFSELHLGSASIRLGSNTGFSFLNLTDNMTQVQLTEGTLNIRVRRLDEDETFEVDTPNLAFTLLRPGNYKVNVNEAGDATVVVVRDGQGEVTGGGSAYTIHPREVGAFNGTDQIGADIESWDNSSDDFDDWCSERDRRIDHSVSARYVSNDVIGYEDLDEYGGWRSTPEYGTIWFPRVAVVGWAPYHYGHWAYIAPWGYTWVDDAPWGFAPFHYGRWVVVGGVWGWVPAPPRPVVVGVAYVRPVYAPALVAWVGGPHFAVGVGVGGGFATGVSVGWFPLGPREVYVPSYHVSRNYVNNVNVTNTTVINKTTVNNVTYVNQRVPGAVSATTPQAFTSAQSVSKNAVTVNAREVATARVVATTPTVAPSRQAVLGAGVSVKARPPIIMENRAVVAKVTPPPPPPSFAKQQQAIQANGGRPLAVSQIRQIQPERSQTRSDIRIAPVATPQNIQTNKMVQPSPNRDGQANANRDARVNPNRDAQSIPNRDGQANANRDARPNPNRDAQANANRDARVNPNRDAESIPNRDGQANANRDARPNPNRDAQANGNRDARVNPNRDAESIPNRDGQANANRDARPNPNRPVTPSNPVNQSGNQPVTPNNAVNKSGNPPVTNTNGRPYTDRPPTSRPNTPVNATNTTNPANATTVNPQPEQKHPQELQNPRGQQDLERQRVEQQQQRDRAAAAQKAADEKAQQQLNQQHQQQLNQQHQQQLNQQHQQQLNQQHQQQPQQLEKKYDTEQQKVRQQPQVEKKKDEKPSKPAKEDKPPKNNK